MKLVIVTGASTGIGRGTVDSLSQSGFEVIACVRKMKDASQWKGNAKITSVLLDVTKEETIQSARKELDAKLRAAKEVSLVNNAGIAVAGPIEAVSLEKWREQFEVNVFGLVRVSQVFLPFIRATRGRIVNISSVSGKVTAPYLGPYSASKFAVEAISDAMRRELAQFGVKVIAIEPGPVATPIWQKGMEKEEELVNGLSSEMANLYSADLRKFAKMVKLSEEQAVPISDATDKIERALTAAKPKARYVVGPRSLAAQTFLFGILPDQWMDGAIAKQFR